MKILQYLNIDLFPTFVKIIDFEVDKALNRAIVSTARSQPDFSDSWSGKNLLAEELPWVAILKRKFDVALSIYLQELDSQRVFPVEVDAHMFLNYTKRGEFTPPHNHIGVADLVGIYYAQAPRVSEDLGSHYYRMPGGMLVLHDPRVDCSLDRRRPETAEYYPIAPRVGRMIIHPAPVLHSVTPMRTSHSRVAVVCNFIIDKPFRRTNYRTYVLHTSSESR